MTYIFNYLNFLFHVFVLLESSGGSAETPNAFIFSLNNFEGLAPFVSKVKEKKTHKAIDRSSDSGPVFGQDLLIFSNAAFGKKSYTFLGECYSVPASVKNGFTVLKGPTVKFSPDEVEVFYLDPSR